MRLQSSRATSLNWLALCRPLDEWSNSQRVWRVRQGHPWLPVLSKIAMTLTAMLRKTKLSEVKTTSF